MRLGFATPGTPTSRKVEVSNVFLVVKPSKIIFLV